MARIPRKAVGPMYIGRVIPEHVKDPRAPVDKSRVFFLLIAQKGVVLLSLALDFMVSSDTINDKMKHGQGEIPILGPCP